MREHPLGDRVAGEDVRGVADRLPEDRLLFLAERPVRPQEEPGHGERGPHDRDPGIGHELGPVGRGVELGEVGPVGRGLGGPLGVSVDGGRRLGQDSDFCRSRARSRPRKGADAGALSPRVELSAAAGAVGGGAGTGAGEGAGVALSHFFVTGSRGRVAASSVARVTRRSLLTFVAIGAASCS